MRFAFILAEKANHRIGTMCRVLLVSRQGFYAWAARPPCARKRRDGALGKQIRRVFEDARWRYGSPRVHRELEAKGVGISRKRVARLMREEGLVARPQRRRFIRTTDSKHGYAPAPNLVARRFQPPAPDRVWASDITYVRTATGWLYLAVVLDLFSRRVVGWSMRPYLDRRLALAALNMAVQTRAPSPGLVHHSDRGVQYACEDYRQALGAVSAVPSMSARGDCWDNAVVESFFSTLKLELLYREGVMTADETRSAIFQYIEAFYNRRRRHSTLGYLSPVQYERRAHAQATDQSGPSPA
jgi:putative transposase